MPLFIAISLLNITLTSIVLEAFRMFSATAIRIEFVLFTLGYLLAIYIQKRKHKSPHPHAKSRAHDPIKSGIKWPTVTKILFWALNICAAVIIVFQIWSVHYNYSGFVYFEKVSEYVRNSQITTPMFSDEWLVASYINKINETKSLPLYNPLTRDQAYPNTLFGFYSLAAGVNALFGFDPVFEYANLYFVFLLLFSISFYYAIRAFIAHHRQTTFIALFGVSMSFLIGNSYSFPGLWTLIPVTGGLIFLFFLIAGLHTKNRGLEYISFIGGMIVYPPLLIFTVPLLYLYDKRINRHYIYTIGIVFIALVGFLATTGGQNIESILKLIKHFIWRWVPGATEYVITPTSLIPLAILVASLCGIWAIAHKKQTHEEKAFIKFFGFVILFWLLGAFFSRELVIGYPRAILVASLLLIVFACYAIDHFYRLHKGNISDILFGDLLVAIMLLASIFMFVWGLEGPRRELHSQKMIYEDLINFQHIKESRFLSTKWKGLAVGVATKNYPLSTKESIVAVNAVGYQHFIGAGCEGKKDLALKKQIQFVYTDRIIACDGFKQVGFTTSEGFRLYKIYASK